MARLKAVKRKELQTEKNSMAAPNKMYLLFTIINREKTEFYVDLIQNFEVNLQTILSANGTAGHNILDLLGLAETEKSVIISIIRRDRAKDALSLLEEKFKTVKGGKGIAYTVPMSSTIGVLIYQFLSNKQSGGVL